MTDLHRTGTVVALHRLSYPTRDCLINTEEFVVLLEHGRNSDVARTLRFVFAFAFALETFSRQYLSSVKR